jgi:hypothetical protein
MATGCGEMVSNDSAVDGEESVSIDPDIRNRDWGLILRNPAFKSNHSLKALFSSTTICKLVRFALVETPKSSVMHGVMVQLEKNL